MSAAPVEKVPETANVNDVTNALSNTSLNDKAAANEAASASAAEGRRLYIGNLAYATTEGELKDFFKDYLVYVATPDWVYLSSSWQCCDGTLGEDLVANSLANSRLSWLHQLLQSRIPRPSFVLI